MDKKSLENLASKQPKQFESYQLRNVVTGEYINCKANKPQLLTYHKEGRLFTKYGAKEYKLNCLKAVSRDFGGLDSTPDEVVQATLKYLANLVIVKVRVATTAIDVDFDLGDFAD